jgi:CBS domain-containing protein
MLVRDFMISGVPTCSPMTPLGVAARMMVEADAPVMAVVSRADAGESGLPVGLLSCSHIATRLVALYRNPLDFCAAEVMSLRGVTLRPSALLEDAAWDLVRSDRDWAVVAEDGGAMVGALSRETALTALRGLASSEPLMQSASLQHLMRTAPTQPRGAAVS